MEHDMSNDSSLASTRSFRQRPERTAPTPHYLGYISIVLLVAALWYFQAKNTKHSQSTINKIQARLPEPFRPVSSDVKVPRSKRPALNARSSSRRPALLKPSKPTQWYREMFFKLHNLEDHADVLPSARDELLAMFSRGISLTLQKPGGGIFSVENYDAEKLEDFMKKEHEDCLEEWGRYLKRRGQGGGPELFGTVEAAKAWLVRKAPAKFVDGAWLAHLHKVTTPFSLRGVTKNAWQVLSEELGDGDLSKHHVYLYEQLLASVGKHLPKGHSADFIKSGHWRWLENRSEWVAAVGQLLISLFPNEFLPEILGFNMHYELITMDTLRANHELKALKINPYYFLVHIVIDNADSGHTAMAIQVVTRYLDMVREKEGEAAVERAWKRVQVGYALSQNLGAALSPTQESYSDLRLTREIFLPKDDSLDPLSARIVNILRAKATVSHQFHCQSRVRIGGQTLAEWLAPSSWTCSDPGRGLQLLIALSQAKPWIIPGASSKSLLMRELAWEGRMFGAFTHDETAALGTWIDALGEGNALLYWNFTRRIPFASKDVVRELRDPARHHPVVMPCVTHESDTEICGPSEFQITPRPLAPLSSTRLTDVIPLWFAHIGLLENTINTPARTSDPMYANLICILRAQAGFEIEQPIVAGTDEIRRLSCPSLVSIGRELISVAGWKAAADVETLHEVFLMAADHGQGEKSHLLAQDMLNWATRPNANLGLLMGLALAFLDLKDAVAAAPDLLAPDSRCVLEAIVMRERQNLEAAAKQLRRRDEPQYRNLIRGYQLGRRALEDLCIEGTTG